MCNSKENQGSYAGQIALTAAISFFPSGTFSKFCGSGVPALVCVSAHHEAHQRIVLTLATRS
jgi:hypothetical protein